jgi:imidazolonepropionase-like amidohydrolase/Tol biopolymer transport system component
MFLVVWIGFGFQMAPTRSPDSYQGRTELELDVEEATFSDVTLSPDGTTIVFTILGHLFRVPEMGGMAEQLTVGPSYNSDPVFSPDGSHLAFVSDRDGSDGNIFVLELGSGDITRVTSEQRAARPVWTPDGQGIAFLSIDRDLRSRGNLTLLYSRVMRAWLDERSPETLTEEAREFRSVFFLPDGGLLATELTRKTHCPRPIRGRNTDRCYLSSIVSIDPAGPALLTDQDGILDRVELRTVTGAFYARRPMPLTGFVPIGQPEHLVSGNFEAGVQRVLTSVETSGRGGTGRWHWSPRFAVSSNGRTLYFNDRGNLWRLDRTTGIRKAIPFKARVRVEAGPRVETDAPRIAGAGEVVRPRTVMDAQLLPDGSAMVFIAAGIIWKQSLDGEEAERLSDGQARVGDLLISPDGDRLAYIRVGESGANEVVLQPLGQAGESRVLLEGADLNLADWSRDGSSLLVHDWDGSVLLLSLSPEVSVTRLPQVPNTNELRFSPDGNGFVFSREYAEGDEGWRDGMSDLVGTVQRVVPVEESEPELLTDHLPGLYFGRPSPDGRWMAFRRQLEIWIAPVQDRPVAESDLTMLSAIGGLAFHFTPGGSAIVYSHGPRVWIQHLDGSEPVEVSIQLEIESPDPGPLAIRNLRVLDFELGGFTEPTTVIVQHGRISSVGDSSQLPDGAQVIDAEARYGIPGLWNTHTHDGPLSPGNLAYGITSVRNLGTSSVVALGVFSDWLRATAHPSPRFFYAGPTVGATITNRRFPFTEVGELERAVREWPSLGMGLFKAYAHLPWSWRRVIGPTAHEAGVRVVSHGDDLEYIVRSVIDGFNGLEHGFSIPLHRDVFQLMAESGIYWCPTLMAGGFPHLALAEPARMEDPRTESFWGEAWRRTANHDFPAAASTGVYHDALAMVRSARESGVAILTGTDRRFGPLLHWELEMFARAGVAPIEVIQAATLNPAQATGVGADLGSIEVGKLADLVVLDADPLADITNTLQIWRVMRGGHVYDPEVLEARALDERKAETEGT